jgi:hypothetical protein
MWHLQWRIKGHITFGRGGEGRNDDVTPRNGVARLSPDEVLTHVPGLVLTKVLQTMAVCRDDCRARGGPETVKIKAALQFYFLFNFFTSSGVVSLSAPPCKPLQQRVLT